MRFLGALPQRTPKAHQERFAVLQFFFLIPFVISCFYVASGQRTKAFLNVYLPCLILIPTYWIVRLPHMPSISPANGALIPIGFSVLFRPETRWRFRRMDLWVVLFLTSVLLSETLREHNPKDGLIIWVQDFIEMFLAYIVGRQLIEPNQRLEVVKRIIFCFIALLPFALWEFRMGSNVFVEYGERIFHVQSGWGLQLRGGHARVSVSFAHAILAGMLLTVAMSLNYYLANIFRLDPRRLGPRMAWLQKNRIPLFAIPLMLYMTGSRMPMACGVLCFLLLQIPRFPSMKTGAITILAIILIGGGTVYAAFQKYTSLKEGQQVDEAQSSAIYRRELLENYAPTLKEGGFLGWGVESFPRFPGQISVDNDYLILQLSQGTFGKYSFILLGVEAVLTLVIAASQFRSRETIYLVFSLMAGLIGIFVALGTVALFEQVIQVTFLLLGWSQSLVDIRAYGMETAPAVEPKFRFRRVFA